ncbi:hypothetical protein J6590_024748 [Homalodisca vitripennis]|nr:hypothetical protein J6590_024748 [Homalodisca vitripennis]
MDAGTYDTGEDRTDFKRSKRMLQACVLLAIYARAWFMQSAGLRAEGATEDRYFPDPAKVPVRQTFPTYAKVPVCQSFPTQLKSQFVTPTRPLLKSQFVTPTRPLLKSQFVKLSRTLLKYSSSNFPPAKVTVRQSFLPF